MQTLSAQESEIFAANRALGQVGFRADIIAGRTRRRDVHEKGSLRVRFPHASPQALEAVLVNTAGGVAGGDRFDVEIAVGPGASLVAGTAAAEKVYRSTGPVSALAIKLSIAEGAQLMWLPQETILFDCAKVARRIDVDLDAHASLVLAEAVIFGRAAMGETVMEGSLVDHWRVRRNGKLVFAETTRLSGGIAETLAHRAVTSGGTAIATVLIAPGRADQVEAVRALSGSFVGEAAISAWNGIAVARLCACDGAALRHDMVLMLAALQVPVPRLWLQ